MTKQIELLFTKLSDSLHILRSHLFHRTQRLEQGFIIPELTK